jgi:hypothetical protein
MDIATIPATGWTYQRCEDCGYQASGQSRKAVLEALLDHAMWKVLREMRRAVYRERAVGVLERLS